MKILMENSYDSDLNSVYKRNFKLINLSDEYLSSLKYLNETIRTEYIVLFLIVSLGC